VNDLNAPALAAAAQRDMGVSIISPNDKGGKLYDPPPALRALCAPLTPMQFNDLYCLARPEVHTLSCGVAKPGDFDEHLRALDNYDRIPEVLPPIEQRRAPRGTGFEPGAGKQPVCRHHPDVLRQAHERFAEAPRKRLSQS
jgi:predicted aldo/keto reductase-like oxidoreductase